MADVNLDYANDRTTAAKDAGDTYTTSMESIRNTIAADSGSGTSLGVMVQSQLQITEAETMYQVKQGIPNNVSKAVKTAAAAVKQTAGS
ncbi:hypothetical protein EB093_01255 [bacterium]|nr:hypothetical protein [bacterium]